MIINLYIEIHRELGKSEFEKLAELESLIRKNGYALYNATDFDSCTSGPCALNTLEEIEIQIEGK